VGKAGVTSMEDSFGGVDRSSEAEEELLAPHPDKAKPEATITTSNRTGEEEEDRFCGMRDKLNHPNA
jgi:hypothetical protein